MLGVYFRSRLGGSILSFFIKVVLVGEGVFGFSLVCVDWLFL